MEGESSTEQYDANGRLKFHPDYHTEHGKSYTTGDLAYICANYRRGKRREVAMAVGRTEATIADLVCRLRKEGLFEHYRKLGTKNLA